MQGEWGRCGDGRGGSPSAGSGDQQLLSNAEQVRIDARVRRLEFLACQAVRQGDARKVSLACTE